MFPEEGLVRRMVTQIRVSLRRFEKLFIAYSAFLETLAERPPKDRHFVSNKHTTNIGTEFGAFLDALYGLRDAVNAIAYRMLFAETGRFQTSKLKPMVQRSQQSAFARLVDSSMFDEDGGDRLLARMSTYH